MNILSVFIDESGDFGCYEKHAPYYLVTMVFHEQRFDLSSKINDINFELARLGLKENTIHTGPLIRREEKYRHFSPNERRHIFTKLYFFAKRCEISFETFLFFKRETQTPENLQQQMVKSFSSFIYSHLHYFLTFETIILYYDNGQHELNTILKHVFLSEFRHCDFRTVVPADYKLFQVADLFCTIELTALKLSQNKMSNSEKLFFHSIRDFKKDFYKGLQSKRFPTPT